jgi:hypothetical protein
MVMVVARREKNRAIAYGGRARIDAVVLFSSLLGMSALGKSFLIELVGFDRAPDAG